MSVIVKHKRGKKSKITVGTDPNQLNVGELFIETDEKKIYTNINNTMTSLTDGASATFSLDAPTADVGKEGDIWFKCNDIYPYLELYSTDGKQFTVSVAYNNLQYRLAKSDNWTDLTARSSITTTSGMIQFKNAVNADNTSKNKVDDGIYSLSLHTTTGEDTSYVSMNITSLGSDNSALIESLRVFTIAGDSTSVNAKGWVGSIIDSSLTEDDVIEMVGNGIFACLFANNTSLVDCSELTFPKVSEYDCSGYTTTAGTNYYLLGQYMSCAFTGCTNLKCAPEVMYLPAHLYGGQNFYCLFAPNTNVTGSSVYGSLEYGTRFLYANGTAAEEYTDGTCEFNKGPGVAVTNKVPYCYSFTGLYHHNASLKRIPPLPSITFCKISSALSGTWESDCFADTTPTSWLTAMQMVYSYVFAYCRSIKIQTYMQYKWNVPHAQSETLYKYITATKSLSGISDSKEAREWGLAGLPPNYSATYAGASGKAPSSDLSQDTWAGSQRSTSITTKWLWGSEHQGFNTLYCTFLGCNNGASGYMYCNSTSSTHGSQDGWRGAHSSAYGNYYIGPDYICMNMYLVYCMCNLQTGTKSWTTNWDDYDTPEVYYSS